MSHVRVLNKYKLTNNVIKNEEPLVANNLDKIEGWIIKCAECLSMIEDIGFNCIPVYNRNNRKVYYDIKYNSTFFKPSDEKEKKAQRLKEKLNASLLKLDYVGNMVNDSFINGLATNIISYTEGSEGFSERFQYYKALIAAREYKNREGVKRNDSDISLSENFDLEEYVKYRGPVVVAEEGLGCGARCAADYGMDKVGGFKKQNGLNAERNFIDHSNIEELKKNYKFSLSDKCQLKAYTDYDSENKKHITRYETTHYAYYYTEPEYDLYNDRITNIFFDKNNKISIQEFNRANVDVSIKYWENTIKEEQCKSTASGVYDFVFGFSEVNGRKEKKLFTFDNKLFENIGDKVKREILIEKYNKNNFTKSDLITNDLLRRATDIDGGPKQWINIHSGTENYTSSQGCPTVYKGDYNRFIDPFIYDKVGLFFLFRNN